VNIVEPTIVWAMSEQKMPGVGDLAPEFSLAGTPDGDPVALSSYQGRSHVLLAFYVFDFSPG
jgi:peroxiredoxin